MTTTTKTLGWTKQCNRCDQTKDASEFYVKMSCVGGRERICKKCRSELGKERRRRKKDQSSALQVKTPRRTGMSATYITGVDRFCGCGATLKPTQKEFCSTACRYPNKAAARRTKQDSGSPKTPSAAALAKAAIVAVSTPPPRIIAQLRQLDPSEVRFLSPALRQFAEKAGILQMGTRR